VTLALVEGAAAGPAPLLKGWLAGVARLTLACGILLTFSRTTWVSLAAVTLLLWIIRPRIVAPALLGVLLAVFAVLVISGDDLILFVHDMANRPEQARGRFELVELALAQVGQYPILGGGLNSFRSTEGTVVHNTLLWFLADFGLIGFVAFVGFVVWFLAKGRLALRFAAVGEKPLVVGLLLAHVAMLGVAMGIEAFYQRHWWLVMALIASSYTLARGERRFVSPGHSL
jgi:hypothetical protein